MNSIIRVPCGVVNCYILTGDTSSILIDTDNPGGTDKITAVLNGTRIALFCSHVNRPTAVALRLSCTSA